MSAECSLGNHRQMVRLMLGIVGHVQRGSYRHSTLEEDGAMQLTWP